MYKLKILNSIGQTISDVSTELLANKNIDQYIHPRTIFNKLLDSTYVLVRQKANFKKILQDSSLIEYLDCQEIEKYEGNDCCGIKEVYRTKKSIRTFSSLLSDGVISVTNPSDAIEFDRIGTFKDYANNIKRQFASKKPMYLVDSDGRVVVLGSPIKAINITIIKSPFKAADDIEKELNCDSIYDKEFPCPEDLLPYVKQATVASFLNSAIFRVQEDSNPNLNPSIKT